MDDLGIYASQSDEGIDLGALALAMVAPHHEGVCLDRYIQHFKKVGEEVAARYDALISGGADDDAGVRLAALKYVLSDMYDYSADDMDDVLHHEILESADIMRVIDRAKGCQSALCLLYMDAARRQGWLIEGVNFPNRFLCRLEKDGVRLIFDPSQQCRVLEAHDLRAIAKVALGDAAELSTDYFNGLGARDTVIHLCNHIKLRFIEMGDYKAALDITLRMRAISPNEYRLLLDAGVLYARTNNMASAASCLNDYIECAPNQYDRQEAALLLESILNNDLIR